MSGLAALAGIALIISSAGGDDGWGGVEGHVGDSDYRVDAFAGEPGSAGGASNASSSGGDSGPPVERLNAPACATAARSDLTPTCPNNDPIVESCIDGSDAIDPWWSRTQRADGTWGEWVVVTWYSCPTDAPLIAAINHEWTQLRPQPSDIELQPNTGWVIATVPTIAMAGDEPRLHATTLLGADVEIRATASGYEWTWGDGSHTRTTDPGSPYPHATVTHTYPHASEAATVSLETTWSGEFRVNNGQWRPFVTTISSESTPVDLEIYDPRSRLVSCDLDGACIDAGQNS